MSKKQSSAPYAEFNSDLANLLESIGHTVWCASIDGSKLYHVNRAAAEARGGSQQAIQDDPQLLQAAVDAQDRAAWNSAWQQAQQGQVAEVRYRVHSPDGVRWLADKLTLLPLTLKGGKTVQTICGVGTDVTAQAQREQLTEQTHEILRALVEDLPMNVVRKNVQGHIEFANQRYCQSMNRSLASLIGKTDFDLFPADLARKYTADDQRVLSSGTAFEDIEQHIGGDGRKVYVQVLKAPVRDEAGHVIGLQIMFWDATARKEAESQLEQERNLLHALLDNVPDSIYFKDKHSRFMRVSRGLAEKFHLRDTQAAVGKSDADFFSKAHARAALDDERELMEGGQPIHGKEEIETWKEGEDTWCSTTKLALRDADGQVIGTFGISRDITKEKRAEAELGRERDLLRTIIDNVPDQIFVKDRAGRFVVANQAMLRMLGGASVEAVLGKTDYDFSQPELACEYVADDQIVMRSGQPIIDQEERSRALDGSERCLLMSKVPLCDSDGQVVGLVGIGRDITRRKRVETELRQAVEVADTASRAKGDFLANMSHEIRTPLNAIIGMTDLALEAEIDQSQRELLSVVQQAGHDLLRVVNDILDFSKIEAGKLELEPVPFDLRDRLGTTMKTLAARAHQRGLELAYRVDPDVPQVVIGDAGRLRQVLLNLLGNAIKFTEEGEVVVEVQMGAASGQDLTLHFSVTDTGIGISEEKCEAIFQEFEQADTSTTRRYGGTGLGLAICSRLVELMGGELTVQSTLGVGSTFRFSIDLQRTQQPSTSRTHGVIVGGMPVLIVDDNRTNRVILSEMVSSWGMHPTQVDAVAAAREALHDATVAGQPFGLILSDVNMPEADGFQLAAWLREQNEYTDLPMIMLTSGGREGDRQRREQLRVTANLTKPVKQSELFDAVIRAVAAGTDSCWVDEPANKNLAGRWNAPVEGNAAATEPECDVVRPLRVLLVEDSPFNQKLAVMLLERDRHQVTLAGNGLEAVEQHRDGEFDIILMDIQMPEMDGYEATRHIRAREEELGTGPIPIVAMTARALKGDKETCLAAGMDAYISKPIDAAHLRQTLIEQSQPPADDGFVLDFHTSTEAPISPPNVSHNNEPHIGAASDDIAPVADSAALSDPGVSLDASAEPDALESPPNVTLDEGQIAPESDSASTGPTELAPPEAIEADDNADLGNELTLDLGADDAIDTAVHVDSAPVVDFAQAFQRMGGGEDKMRVLAEILLEECPKMLAQLDEALAQRDAVSVRRVAHTIKGNAGHFFAKQVVHVAQQIELCGERNELDGLQPQMEKLQTEVERMTAALRARFPMP